MYFWFPYYIEQMDSKLLCICSAKIIDDVKMWLRTSVTHSPNNSWDTSLFLPQGHVIHKSFVAYICHCVNDGWRINDMLL